MERLESTLAPRNAPIAPGTASRATTPHSTLPKRQCEKPDTAVVPTSARWTEALAVAGLMPATSSNDVDVTP